MPSPSRGVPRGSQESRTLPASHPHEPDELLEECGGLRRLVQGHDALVAQEALEDLALEAQQQLVRVEHLGLVGGGRAHPQHRVAAIAVLQQLLQPLQQRQRVVDGGRRGVPAKVGFLGCREMGPSRSSPQCQALRWGGVTGGLSTSCLRSPSAKGLLVPKGVGEQRR